MELKEYAHIVRLVLEYLGGKLPEEEQQELADWVNRSEKRRFYFRKWCDEKQQDQLLAKVGSYDVAEGWEMVLRKRHARQQRRRWMYTAASVALLLGGLATFRYMAGDSPATVTVVQEEGIRPGKRMARLITAAGESVGLDTLQQLETENLKVVNADGTFVIQALAGKEKEGRVAYHCLEVPRGGEFSFELPDGSRVFLNADSRLRFPERFVPGQERIVYLSGEAYFDVARDTASPFLVCLEHSVVKVLGTSFNVMAYPDEGREETTLVSGAVRMGNAAAGEWIELAPGQQGCYDTERGSLSQREVEVSYYTSWKDGVFAFYKQPLEQVMKILERWYLFDIHYQDPALKSILYTGKVARHASIQEVLHTFELLDEIRFEVQGKEITVRRK